LYKAIPGRNAAVLMSKGGPTPVYALFCSLSGIYNYYWKQLLLAYFNCFEKKINK
jgi:hypothetical protein